VEVSRGLHKNIKQGCDPRDYGFDPVMRSSDTLPAVLQMRCTIKQNYSRKKFRSRGTQSDLGTEG